MNSPTTNLSNVGVHPSIVLLSFEVFSLDEALHSLLDKLRRRDESDAQLLGNLGDEVVVVEHLSRLHDSNNGSFYEVAAILLHIGRNGSATTISSRRAVSSRCTCRSRRSRRTACCCFLHTNKRYSNSPHLTCKVGIESDVMALPLDPFRKMRCLGVQSEMR